MTDAPKHALIVSHVGTFDSDDMPDGPCVVLTGSVEAVKEAAKLWADEVRLVPASADLTPQRQLPHFLADEQLGDACMSYRHDYGLMDAEQRKKLCWEAAEWWRCIRRALEIAPKGGA